MDPTCWQKILLDSTPLSMIDLPGTHDSLTQYVTLSLFSRCQKFSVGQQLEMGIRLFDIRLELIETGFHAVHGIADCRTTKSKKSPPLFFENVFTAIIDFLRIHPSETVVIFVKMERGSNSGEFFPAFYKQFIEHYLSTWFLENRIPSLAECRGKIVLLRRCGLGNSECDFTDDNTGLNFTKCFDAGSSEGLLPPRSPVELLNGNHATWSAVIQDKYMLTPKNKWNNAVKPLLENSTHESSTILINYLSTAGIPFMPCINSKYVNSKFNAYQLQSKNNCGWICFDFPAKELVNKIIENNL